MVFNRRISLVCACFVLAASIAYAQQRETQKAEVEIRQWLTDFTKAFTARDTKSIMALYSPDVVAYDLSPPLAYAGSENYRNDYADFFKQFTGPLGLEIRGLRIQISGDLAVAHGLEHVTGQTVDGQSMNMWIRFTSVFRKINGRWLDVHDHISVPADFATGKAILDLKP